LATALRFDTLKLVRRLTDAGMERPMSEAIAEGLGEADTSKLATKADILAFKADNGRLEARTDTGVAELRAEMFRFMMLQAVTIVGLTDTLIKLLP
jgi:hypothetical protein